jgi:hypothetical protein
VEIKILAPEEVEFKEKDIQNAFEKDLTKLEEALEFIASEVIVGAGRIDTLAFDTDNGNPVFIEYKKSGDFGKDALIQLMDYLSWFVRDENRISILEKIIRSKKHDIEYFDPSIRLICVVPDVEDRIRNSIYAITNHVKVFSYMVAKDTADKVILVPKLELDNRDIILPPPPIATETELLAKRPHLKDIFYILKSNLEQDGAICYTTARSFRFKKDRVFAIAHLRKDYIKLGLRVGQGVVSDPNFKYRRQGSSSWGYTEIYPNKELGNKVSEWIEIAKNKANDSLDDLSEDE